MKTWFTVRNTLIVSTLSGVILLAILSVVAWRLVSSPSGPVR